MVISPREKTGLMIQKCCMYVVIMDNGMRNCVPHPPNLAPVGKECLNMCAKFPTLWNWMRYVDEVSGTSLESWADPGDLQLWSVLIGPGMLYEPL